MKYKLKENLFLTLVKLILNFFSDAPEIQLMLKVSPSPNATKLFLQLSA